MKQFTQKSKCFVNVTLLEIVEAGERSICCLKLKIINCVLIGSARIENEKAAELLSRLAAVVTKGVFADSECQRVGK